MIANAITLTANARMAITPCAFGFAVTGAVAPVATERSPAGP